MIDHKFWLVFLIAIGVYTANIWGPSIYILDEAKNASCAREMFESGNLITPTFNGEIRTDKPPLHYYAMMVGYAMLGSTPLAARIFSALAGVATIMLVYCYTRKQLGQSAAFFSSLTMVASLQLAIQFHMAVPDPYLLLFLTATLLLGFEGIHHANRLAMLGCYAAAAFAFLTKGLIAIVFPAMIMIAFMVSQKKFSLRPLHLPAGIPLFLLIALPWYIAVGIETNGEWLKGFFIEHHFSRFTSTMEGHKGFPLASFVIAFVALLPTSLYTPHALRYMWHSRKENSFLVYCGLAVLVILLFFSFSRTILPGYPAPALPFLAIILGSFVAQYKINSLTTRSLLPVVLYTVIVCLFPPAVFLACQYEPTLIDLSWIAVPFLILPITALAGLYLVIKKRIHVALYSLLAGWIILILIVFYVVYPEVDKRNPVTQSEHFISGSVPIASFKTFNPAYAFSLKRKILVLTAEDSVTTFFQRHPNGIILTTQKYYEKMAIPVEVLFRQKDLFEKSETVLLKKTTVHSTTD